MKRPRRSDDEKDKRQVVVNGEEHDPLPTMSKLDLPYNISSDTDKFLAGQNGGPVLVISDASDAQTNPTHVETQAAQPLMFLWRATISME